MTMNDIIKLIDAGYTKADIDKMIADNKPQKTPEKKEDSEIDTLKKIQNFLDGKKPEEKEEKEEKRENKSIGWADVYKALIERDTMEKIKNILGTGTQPKNDDPFNGLDKIINPMTGEEAD